MRLIVPKFTGLHMLGFVITSVFIIKHYKRKKKCFLFFPDFYRKLNQESALIHSEMVGLMNFGLDMCVCIVNGIISNKKILVKLLQDQFFLYCWTAPLCWSLISCKINKFLCDMWCVMCYAWCVRFQVAVECTQYLAKPLYTVHFTL